VILGSGPNGSDRESNLIIAAAMLRSPLHETDETIMINCNPETVSD